MTNDDTKYVQIAENMRFYGDMRFKQLTLLLAGVTALGAGIAQYPTTPLFSGWSVRGALSLFGLLFTAVMWVMEVRSTLYWVAHRQFMQGIWPRPANSFLLLNATNVVLVLHVAIYWFWFQCVTEWVPWATIGGFLGLILLGVFTVYSYWPLWNHNEK